MQRFLFRLRVITRTCTSGCNTHPSPCIYPALSFVATGKFYILSGQHRFKAARKLAQQMESEARTAPAWARTFTCTVVRKETSLEMRQVKADTSDSEVSSLSSESEKPHMLLPWIR